MKNRIEIIAFLLSLTGVFMLPSAAQASFTSNLTVEVNGLRNRNGQVCLSLFANSQGFPDRSERAVKSQCVRITEDPLQVTFENLPSGSYAIAAFHDSNSSGQLQRNFLGIPTEEFGFSGNPVIRTGPPEFNEAAVLVVGATTRVQIQLRSLL
ncbi:MAG TPA: DUF2141 domain-containing protein [Coleofasciculaceae cyanobacterium]